MPKDIPSAPVGHALRRLNTVFPPDAAVSGRRRGGRRQGDPINFYTITEVAERLAVATRTVRRWIESRELVAHHLGRAVRIADSDLDSFLALRRRA